MKYWDVVACEAVIKAAGGQATDAWGKERLWEEDKGRAEEWKVEGGLVATLRDHSFYVLPEHVDIQAKI